MFLLRATYRLCPLSPLIQIASLSPNWKSLFEALPRFHVLLSILLRFMDKPRSMSMLPRSVVIRVTAATQSEKKNNRMMGYASARMDDRCAWEKRQDMLVKREVGRESKGKYGEPKF